MARVICAVLFVVASGMAAQSAVDPSDGVSVLLLLSEPYGANTNLWFSSFEKMGWTVTVAGLKDTIEACSYLCTAVRVDRILDGPPDITSYDALVVSTTPGTAATVSFPAEDLRTSALALEWIRQADADGIVLYAGCSGLLVLGDAGILTGRRVACHQELIQECKAFGATCVIGGQSLLPLTTGNVITGTSGRYFAQEVGETISWALDPSVSAGRAASISSSNLNVQTVSLPAVGPAAGGWALGASRSDGARAVCSLGSDLVIVGYTYSAPGGTQDLLAVRCDTAGNILWAKAIGGAGTDAGEGVCATADGGVVAVGRTTSVGAGVDDVLLVKLDGNGNLIWAKTFGGVGPDAGFAVVATADGGYAACGRTSPAIGTASDLFLVRVDKGGNEVWTAKAGGARLERAHALAERADGTLLVGGGTTSSGRGNYDALLCAFSPTGSFLWDKTYGLTAFDVAEDLVLQKDGGVFLAGSGDEDGKDGNDVLAVRFDAAGTFVGANRIGDRMSFDYGEAALELASGGFLVCGACTSPSTLCNDALLLRLGADGSVVWTQKLGDATENEWASAMCSLPSGEVAVVGHTLSAGAGAHDVLVYFVDPSWSP